MFHGSTNAVLLFGVKVAVLIRDEKSAELLRRKPVHPAELQAAGVSWKKPPDGAFAGVPAVSALTFSSGK
jgi:hypothetical protein